MSRETFPLRRAVLKLGTSGVDRTQLRAAAEFARLLQLEMLGVFVEDPMLLGAASLPFARELRLPGFDWQALQPQSVVEDLRASAQRSRQLFEHEAEAHGVPGRFEVHSADAGGLAGSLLEPSDVVIVAEPGAMDVLGSERERQRRAASISSTSELLLPRSGMPQLGPISVVRADESGRCFALASRIAGASGGEIVIVEPGEQASLLGSLSRRLGTRRERLLIVPREGISREELTETLNHRRTPVLLVACS